MMLGGKNGPYGIFDFRRAITLKLSQVSPIDKRSFKWWSRFSISADDSKNKAQTLRDKGDDIIYQHLEFRNVSLHNLVFNAISWPKMMKVLNSQECVFFNSLWMSSYFKNQN